MSIRFMIIDENADFRSLIMHHITTHWPDANISAYDPVTAGHLPDEFSGAGNDAVLLGNRHGDDRDGIDALQRFLDRRSFPPIIYFCSDFDEAAATALGPAAVIARGRMNHEQLIDAIQHALLNNRRLGPAKSRFESVLSSGRYPDIRGYRFIDTLSSSPYSGVYLAERQGQPGQVALKILWQLPQPGDGVGAFDRFLQEYETIASMDHENIVHIHDLAVSDDHAHIAMEYLDGGDLRDRIDAGIKEPDAVRCVQQIAAALSAVHEKHVLHRDLKPDNVMLRADGSVALIDFGLAKRARLEAAMTGKGKIFGTPYYMSPEQGHGADVDERSDLYSLGIIFYELLTGDKPYRADTAMGVIYKHARSPIPRLPDSLSHHQALLDRLLAKEPDDRPKNAQEVQNCL